MNSLLKKGKEVFDEMNRLGNERIPFLFAIDFDKENGMIFPLSELPDEISYSTIQHSVKYNKSYEFIKKPISFNAYKKQFDEITKAFDEGLEVINLCCDTEIETDLSLEEIYEYADSKYRLIFKNHFVCFSPETFVKIKDGKILTYPMKGTIDAGIENAAEIILNDPKEIEEHQKVVDLMCEDIKKVAANPKISKFRYIDEIQAKGKKILQVSSEIEAELGKDFNRQLGDIFDKLLPAASICGVPKNFSLEVINKAEKMERGFYTGVFGVFDGENLDSSVLIRFIEKRGKRLIYKSGGGVTPQSVAEKEYNEISEKVYVPFN